MHFTSLVKLAMLPSLALALPGPAAKGGSRASSSHGDLCRLEDSPCRDPSKSCLLNLDASDGAFSPYAIGMCLPKPECCDHEQKKVLYCANANNVTCPRKTPLPIVNPLNCGNEMPCLDHRKLCLQSMVFPQGVCLSMCECCRFQGLGVFTCKTAGGSADFDCENFLKTARCPK